MPVRRPYYGLHQIIAGQYTAGNEYVVDNGDDYIGSYHVLPNGQIFTESVPQLDSQELFEKRFDITDTVQKYNRIKNLKTSKYLSPVSYRPQPEGDDYEEGEIQRFFVQKRNNPIPTITEINNKQFNSINKVNSEGINGVIWNSVLIPWKISKISRADATKLNSREIQKAEQNFTGIANYLTNVLEYYR